MADMRVVNAGRIRLEPLVMDHALELFVVLSDPAIYEFENDPPRSLEWLRYRYSLLERRASPDGREKWLNWAVRISNQDLIGYVQATLHDDGRTFIAYEFSSQHWGKNLAFEAVTAMLLELREHYQVSELTAILKQKNHRSERLLRRLGFREVELDHDSLTELEVDELLMRT